MKRAVSALALGLLLMPIIGVARAASWRYSNPKPHGNNIIDMLLRDGTVWQVGDRGRIYTSEDLDNWVPRESGTTRSLRSLTVFQGKVFISGEEGTIVSGDSASSLALRTIATTDWLEGIAASANTIVAVGDNGAIYSSANGIDWVRRGNFTAWLRSVAYAGGQFICVGEDGFLATSNNGQSWTKRNLATTAHLNKVAFFHDRFWVVGDRGTVLTNNLLMNFVPVNIGTTNTLFALAANANEVIVVGDRVVQAGNLQTGSWTPQADAASPNLAPLWPYYSALWDGRLFLLGGRTGMKVEGFRTSPTSALTWYSEVQPTRNWLWSATHLLDLYAACGVNGTIVTSTDGIEWFSESVPDSARPEVLLGIGGNTNALVCAGSDGMLLMSPNVLTNSVSTNSTGQRVTNQVSLLGLLWTQVSSQSTNDLQGVAANANTFVVTGGKGTILTSADAVFWQARTSGITNFLSGVTAWPQGFVAVGVAGAILGSSDGISWIRRSSGVGQWVYSIRYVGEKLIAVGENGLILTSDDGTQWRARVSGTTEWLNDVAFVNSKWYILGGSGLILTSTDTITWTAIRSITSKSLYGAATDGKQLIAAGLEGVILRNQVVPQTTPVNILLYDIADRTDVFLFGGVPDQRFALEEKNSIDASFVPVVNLELFDETGTLIFERPNEAARSKFFRTRLLTD
jgi:hypothetical protein